MGILENSVRWFDRPVPRLALGAALCAIVALVIGVGTYVIVDLGRLSRVVQDVHQRSMLDLDLIGELQYQTQEARRSVLYALGTSDSNEQVDYADQSRAADAVATSLAARLRQNGTSRATEAVVQEFEQHWLEYLALRDEVLASILEGDTEAAMALDLRRGIPEFGAVRSSLLELKQALRLEAAGRLQRAHEASGRSVRKLAATLALTLVFAAAAVALVFRFAKLAVVRESERRMREVVESISEAMVVLDRQGRITLWNPSAQTNFGATRERALGRKLIDLLPDLTATPLPEAIAGAVRQQQRETIAEVRHVHAGAERFYEARIFPFDGGVTLFFNDVTQRKQAEEDRLSLERKLLESQKLESLGVLAGGIAHDFNNLLTAILGNASLASFLTPPGSPLQSHLTEIERTSRQASSLCQQMLAYAGRGRFHVQTVCLESPIEELRELLRVSVGKNVELHFDLTPELPAATLDTTQVKQVLLNLVINASEAIGSHPGAVRVRTRVWRASGAAALRSRFVLPPPDDAAAYVCLEVADNGCGMTAETKARIFDPFFTTKFTGRGLGLAAVLGIMRSHRGALQLESSPETGTTFTCYFPVATASATAELTLAAPSTAWRGSGRVLVVDDEAPVRRVVANMLEMTGFEPVVAEDGEEGVALFRAHPDRFSAVILDITMPRMDGHEALRHLLAIKEDLRVLIISGFSEQEVSSQLVQRSRTAVVQKPFEIDNLREKLRGLMA